MKVIKWLGAGVIILLAVAVVVVKFVAPPIIKAEAEKALTEQWGAEVNIGAVEIQLFPVGMTVWQVQLTNPDKADENLIMVERLYAEPALMDTLKKGFSPVYPIVELLEARGIQLHQPRTAAGRILPKKPDPLAEQTEALIQQGLPSFKLPDPERVLETEPLKTVEAAAQLKQAITRLEQQWQQLQADLPSQKTLDRYQAEIEQLKKGGLSPQTLQQLKQLQAALERDQKKLTQAQRLLAEVDQLKAQLKQLETLPQQDWQRLRQKYTFSARGMEQLMQTLLGAQAQAYIEVGTAWIAKLRPFLAPKQDAETTPNPALNTLVRRLHVDAQLPQGRVELVAHDLTLKQALYQKTTTYQLNFQPLYADKPLSVKGVVDMLKPAQARVTAALQGVDVQLKAFPLLASPELSVRLQQAQSDWSGEMTLSAWQHLEGQLNAQFKQVVLQLTNARQPEAEKYLKPLLEQVKTFNLMLQVSGDVYAPKVVLHSDLDDQLGRQMAQQMQRALNDAKARLRTALTLRAQQEMGALSGMLQPLLEGKVQVDQLKAQVQTLLEKQLKQALSAQQLPVEKIKLPDALQKAVPQDIQLPENLKLPF